MNIEALTLSPPESQHEADRLYALAESNLTDSATVGLFVQFAELAASIAQTPCAWISVVDGQQELVLASVGMHPLAVHREGSAADHVVKTGSSLTLYFPAAELPFETAVPIAFYAGIPLRTSGGAVIGVLGVANVRTHTLSPYQLEALQKLAALAMQTAELNNALTDSRHELEERRVEREQLGWAMNRLQDVTIAKEVREAELAERNAQLQTMAETDGMTGLRNYRSFDEYTFNCIANNQPIALLLIDIDWFKNFNDAYGHVAGDETLRSVADLIAASIEPGTVAARYGGEEFAVVMKASNTKQALDAAERLRLQIERHVWPHRPITICVGVALRTPEMQAVQDLVRRADQALYAAKRTGKNRVLAWSQD